MPVSACCGILALAHGHPAMHLRLMLGLQGFKELFVALCLLVFIGGIKTRSNIT